jgi:hypothetical protein
MLIDSKHKHLNLQEIVRISLQNTNSKHDFQAAFLSIVKELTLPSAKPIRIGNTLFILHISPKDPSHAMFRALNADSSSNYLDNSKNFIKQAKKMGFKVLVSQFKSESILHLFKMISKKPPFPNMGFIAQKTTDGGYQATINMGDK